MSQAIVGVHDLCFHFPRKKVLDGLSFSLQKGEWVLPSPFPT